MTKRLQYMLELGVSDSADVEEVENFLQQVLLDLYEQGQVESIKVTKKSSGTASIEEDDDLDKVLDVLHDVESEDIRRAIDSVRELEQFGDDDG